MNGMPGYYGQPYHGVDPQSIEGYAQDNGMEAMNSGMMSAGAMGQPQTLDQIISQNHEHLMRQRAFQPSFRQPTHHDHVRRASMHEFGSPVDNTDLANFQFDPNPHDPNLSMAAPAPPAMAPSQKPLDPRRVRSREDLSLNTRFSQLNASFGDMSGMTNYSPALMSNEPGAMESSPAYLQQALDPSADYNSMTANATTMPMDTTLMASDLFSASPMAQNFHMTYMPPNPNMGTLHNTNTYAPTQMITADSSDTTDTPTNQPFAQSQNFNRIPASIPTLSAPNSSMPSPVHKPKGGLRRQSVDMAQPLPVHQMNGDPGPMASHAAAPVYGPALPPSKYANAYSSSGFDMLGVLMRVATRRKPEINIGPVDLSCAFVVCDIDKFDLPIVYCSEMFERLTGYTKHEILGRNCRFLQAPDGKVQSGVKRKYVDDRSVLYLKNQISKRSEAQLSLINYRKGGQPFMNLLTMIPIPFDSDDFKFYVGFQVDLVEQPGSVSGVNPDGSYSINYNRSSLPAYALPPPPDPNQVMQDVGQTIPRDEVSQVLATIGRGESELSRRLWDKILLENTDDVVHVLSLKGLFLYLSPASRKVLEYDAAELVGMALSSVCHPSDIVPVTRELKDASTSAVVNVVYRIRRKHSGYTWFEAHGSLHTEQGKGRKCLILVGRERPVYALDRADLTAEGNLGESELWSKISTSGMFLHVSSTSRVMLDRLPEDLVGTSMQSLMRPESRPGFMNLLELARSGQKGVCRHDLQNRRGQVLHAQTAIYPGDSRPGSKPTFLLAQTRLLKMTRATLSNHKSSSTAPSPRTDQASTGSGTPAHQTPGQVALGRISSSSTTTLSTVSTFQQANASITNPGNQGLTLGSQDEALASEDNIFDELKTTRSTSWQFELRQMERQNRVLAEELQGLLSRRKKRKRRKGLGQLEKDCANCHTRVTPEWRRGPSGNRDLCNSCGLRWAKQNGRVSPRKYSGASDKSSTSPAHVPSASMAQDDERAGADHINNIGSKSDGAVPSLIKQHSNSSNGGGTDSWRGSIPPKIEEAPDEPNVLPT